MKEKDIEKVSIPCIPVLHQCQGQCLGDFDLHGCLDELKKDFYNVIFN